MICACLAGLLLALPLTIGFGAPAAADPTATVIDVAVDEGRLTVDVRDAPLAEVLRAVGERVGVDVTLQGDLSAPVTQSFAGVPLEDGIRRLARGHSVMVTYGAPAGDAEPAKVAGVWVMATQPSTARASIDFAPSTSSAGAPAVKDEAATGESPLAPRIGEIGRLAEDADHGSAAAILRLGEIGSADADAELRQQAVAALGRLTDPAAESMLVAALGDEEVDVRLRAVRGLRRFGTDTAVQSIAGLSLTDPDPRVRLAAINALTSLPGGSMLQGLAIASSDPDDAVRAVAIRGLAWWSPRWPLNR